MNQLIQLEQIVPSKVCLSCDVCCRFLEQDSFLAPIFTQAEMRRAIANGVNPNRFRPTADGKSAQVKLIPHGDMYICPCFNPETSECTIYSIRPLDCQIYPFALMYNQDRTQVVLGVDMICPYGEEEIQTEGFQHYIDYMADYLESDSVVETIAVNWQLIGSYQETVVIVRTLEKLTLARTKNRG
jgi:Fe-S-cluster containining protein